jgi:hypothetical protein
MSMRKVAYSPELIREYLEAFRAANTMAEVPDVVFHDGWYIVKTQRGYPAKYRRAKLEAMRDTLRSRVAEATS